MYKTHRQQSTVSVRRAIWYGQLAVNFPAVLFFVLPIAVSFYIIPILHWPKYYYAFAFLIGILLAWAYWALAITRWRIWAFQNVRNVHELNRQAVERKLIWDMDSALNLTEFRTQRQKAQWERIMERFANEDYYREDVTLPSSTAVFISAKAYQIRIGLALFLVGLSLYFLLIEGSKQGLFVGSVLLGVGGWEMRNAWIKLRQTKPVLVFSEKGIQLHDRPFIPWDFVFGISFETKNERRLVLFHFYDEWGENDNITLDINDLDKKRDEIDALYHSYRLRFKRLNLATTPLRTD